VIGNILFMVWILGPGGLIYSKSYNTNLPFPCTIGEKKSVILDKKVALILECGVFKGVTHWSLQSMKKSKGKGT